MLAPTMQFYIYRIDRAWAQNGQGELALLILKKKLGLVRCLLLDISNEWLWHNGS
jgi:hypothetical protein